MPISEIRVRSIGYTCKWVYAYLHSIRMCFLVLGLEEGQYTLFVLFRFFNFRFFDLAWTRFQSSLRLYEFCQPPFQKVDASYEPIRGQIEKRKRTNHVDWPLVRCFYAILRPRGPSGEWTKLQVNWGAGWQRFRGDQGSLPLWVVILVAFDSVVTPREYDWPFVTPRDIVDTKW